MEQMVKKSMIPLSCLVVDQQEECPIIGEYSLPEYCPDIAVVLKCFAEPRIQNRQWSADQWLLDGNAVIRVWYLDEKRDRVFSVEFSLPFSCAVRGVWTMRRWNGT